MSEKDYTLKRGINQDRIKGFGSQQRRGNP